MKRKLMIFAVLSLCLVVFASCSAAPTGPSSGGFYPMGDASLAKPEGTDNYQFGEIIESDFVPSAENNKSYFSLDRNTASYSIMRREISENLKVEANSVRLEEYVNYFNYNYARPTDGNALALSGGLFDCPWNSKHKLFTIGVAAETISMENAKPNNIVFLIDTSGSMYGADRLGLIQQSFTMLLDCLADGDFVSIVTYAGDSRVALNGARGVEKNKIANVLQDLQASGSTNGEGGIQKAYAVAESHFIEGGNNRVVLATDGDFNVGVSSTSGLKQLITEKRESGIYLSVLGVGMFNTNDSTMKTLAENGNGNYAYLDSVSEARRVLVEEIGGTFNVVAQDAKIGVEFNKDNVVNYRLIGYETKVMSEDEFNDEKKDAGEIGSGHTVTAVYELQLAENADGDIAKVEVRYKTPETKESRSVARTYTTADITATPSEDSKFISCVVEYGLLLRESEYKADASFTAVINRLKTLQCVSGDNADPFKTEFLEIVRKAESIYAK